MKEKKKLNLKGCDGWELQFLSTKMLQSSGIFITIKWSVIMDYVLDTMRSWHGVQRDESQFDPQAELHCLSINFDRSCNYREHFTQTNTQDMAKSSHFMSIHLSPGFVRLFDDYNASRHINLKYTCVFFFLSRMLQYWNCTLKGTAHPNTKKT